MIDNVTTAVDAIYQIQTQAELNRVLAAYKVQAAKLQSVNALSFNIGQKVQFRAKSGMPVFGTITKINRTSIVVKTDVTTWRVSPSLLQPDARGTDKN